VNRDNSTSLIIVAVAGGKGDKGVLAMPSPYRALKYRAPKLLIAIYSQPSLFVCSYFVVSYIRRVAPARKVRHSNPSMDSSVEIFRQLGQAFERHCVMFKELTGEKEAAVIAMFLLRKGKHQKILKYCFWGPLFFRGFSLSARVFGI
jgi:aminoglycoside N3'-acetyltransferase